MNMSDQFYALVTLSP